MDGNTGTENAFTIEVDGEEVEVVHMGKPGIEFDGLEGMGQAFFENAVEGDADAPEEAVYIATIRRNLVEDLGDGRVVHLPSDYVELVWAKDLPGVNPGIKVMSEEELRSVEWPNNLDTLIDDTTGVTGMALVIFAGLECARQGRQVYLQRVPNDENTSMVWFI